MFNVGGGEVLVILLVALLVLGPDKLPEAARNAGKMMRQIRQLSSGFQQEIRQALDDDPSSKPPTGVPGTSSGPALPPLNESPDLSAAAAEAAVAGEVQLSPNDAVAAPGTDLPGSNHRSPTSEVTADSSSGVADASSGVADSSSGVADGSTGEGVADGSTGEQVNVPQPDISFDGPGTSFG